MRSAIFDHLLSYYCHPLRSFRRLQSEDMVAPRLIATQLLQKRKEGKIRTKGANLNRADIQILGPSDQGQPPSILVNSEGNAYLFNCGEGTQRNCYANRVKLSNLEHLFVTRLQWSAVSGAYGLSLTLQDLGAPSFTMHSSEGIQDFFKSAENFMSFTTGIDCTAKDCSNAVFDDSKLRVKCIPLDEVGNQDERGDEENATKKTKKSPSLVAFHCSLPDLPGVLNPQRCRELGVPIGPKLAQLKSGHDVTLDNGNVVKSSDVCGTKIVGPSFLVIDCPTLQDIGLLSKNHELELLRGLNDCDRHLDLVLHLSPNEVTENDSYKQWIDGFADDCRHLILANSEYRRANLIDCHRLQYLLQQIDPNIFPSLYMPKHLSDILKSERSSEDSIEDLPDPEDTDLKMKSKGSIDEQDKVIKTSPLDRLVLRPFRQYEYVDPKMSIDSVYKLARLEVDFEERYSHYKEATKNIPPPQVYEPEVVFLGTGSALPSKLRNTSCILVNLEAPEKVSIILDCGEDSYGQIFRHYGPDKASEILRRLRMIYISHHHADHHIGLIELLRQRKRAGATDILQVLIPSAIKDHLDYFNSTFEDLSSTYSIWLTKDLRLKSGLDTRPSPLVGSLCRSLNDLLSNISMVAVEHCHDAYAVVLDINISRPGMKSFKLAYSGDARPSLDLSQIGHNCDLLIHEATFDHNEVEAAQEKKHSTTSEAIDLAKMMQAKFTILTHFSQKYPKIPYFTEKFDETIGYAFDNMAIKCPSQLPRIPLMKDLMKVVFAKSLSEIDARHNKSQSKRKVVSK